MAKPGPKGPSRYTPDYVNQIADELINYVKTIPRPTLYQFAAERNIPSDEFSNNKDLVQHLYFSRAIKIAKDFIITDLWQNGLRGIYPPALVIFGMKNYAGWRDSFDVKGEGFETKNIIQVFVPEAYEKRTVLESAQGAANRSI